MEMFSMSREIFDPLSFRILNDQLQYEWKKKEKESIDIQITNNVRMMAIENMQAIGFSAEFGMSPFENYTIAGKRQQYKIIGDTQVIYQIKRE